MAEAFHKTSIDPCERWYRNRDNTNTTKLIDLSRLDPDQQQSKFKVHWAVGD